MPVYNNPIEMLPASQFPTLEELVKKKLRELDKTPKTFIEPKEFKVDTDQLELPF